METFLATGKGRRPKLPTISYDDRFFFIGEFQSEDIATIPLMKAGYAKKYTWLSVLDR